MSRYIDVERLLKENQRAAFYQYVPEICEAVDAMIKNQPTANVQEVRYGKWTNAGTCTNCGFHKINYKTPYCPNCGAKMNCEHFKERSEIIELPCKVGDTVYHLQRTGNIAKRKVERFEASTSGVYFVFDNKEKYPIEWKTVFLTKEAAEQALREREQE